MSGFEGGTLARLLPVARIDGRIVKWRVEVGDLGDAIGTVMKTPGRDEYDAFYFRPGDETPARHYSGFANPALAALRLAAELFALLPEEEPTPPAGRSPRSPLRVVA